MVELTAAVVRKQGGAWSRHILASWSEALQSRTVDLSAGNSKWSSDGMLPVPRVCVTADHSDAFDTCMDDGPCENILR